MGIIENGLYFNVIGERKSLLDFIELEMGHIQFVVMLGLRFKFYDIFIDSAFLIMLLSVDLLVNIFLFKDHLFVDFIFCF